jgi:hypothetical protein
MIPEVQHTPPAVISPEEYKARYRDDYPLWMEEVMGAEITIDQLALSKGLVEYGFVSAKSGTTTGKTTCAATTGLWFLTTRYESKVVCTAPTGHQLEDLLFAEMESWIRQIRIPFIQESLVVIKNKIYIKGFRDWYIVARTIPKDAKDKLGDVLAGFHAPDLLFIVDEASAVPDAVFSGIEGSMIQKNVYCLLVGNPTRAHGYFYDTHNKNRDQWCTVTLSSINSPFVDKEWIERMKNLYGEDSDWYKTKILGVFPTGEGEVVATYDQLLAAFERHKVADYSNYMATRKVAGLDPGGGGGDNSILIIRQGAYCHEPIRIKHKDTNDLIIKVTEHCVSQGVKELYVEYNGLGIAIFDQLKLKHGFKSWKVVTNARPNDPEAYRNIRAELYKELSNSFDLLLLPWHDRFVQELPEIHFIPDSEPLQVVDKKKLRNRLGFSPDFSDALMLSTYRHFDLGKTEDDYAQFMAFTQMNNNLNTETSFAKI